MKRLCHFLPLLFSFHFLFFMSSCTQETYEKGDGKYSLMRGDFVEARVNANRQIVSLTTDDGDLLELTAPYSAKWIETADTVYRCMLYYNKVENQAEVVSMGQVPCASITLLKDLNKPLLTAPVKFESTWMSKTGKYINLSFALKTGTTEDDEAIHSLRVVQDTIMTNPDGTSTSYLRLYHDQGGVPDYYSTQVYASLITSEILADSACISINTYKGIITKAFQINKE